MTYKDLKRAMLRILASSLAVGVLVLYIASCGGGGDDAPTSTPTIGAAPTSTPTTSAASGGGGDGVPTSTPTTSAVSGGGGDDVATSTPTISAASGGSVTSPDGSLTLSIPSGALPTGMAVESISVLPLSSEELERWSEGSVLAGYDLKPDGLEFTEPVSVTLRLPLPATGFSFQILLVSDDTGNETQGIEEVRVLEVESNEETGELVVRAELSHFSQMVVSVGFFDISLEAPDNVMVGETFTAVAKVELTTEVRLRVYEFEGENFVSTKTATGNWQLEGVFTGSFNLSPITVPDRPPLTSLSLSTRVFTIQQAFKCESEGPFTIQHFTELNAEEHWIISRRPDASLILDVTRESPVTTKGYVKVDGLCVTAPPSPSPSPVTAVTATDDAINDSLDCVTGEPSTSPLPLSMDIIHVSVELDAAIPELIFTIEFAGEFTEEFWGGIELYFPDMELVPFDTNWFFNNTGNLSFNFHLNPPTDLNFDGIFRVEGGGWFEARPDYSEFYTNTSVIHTDDARGDRIEITLPAVPSPAGEDISWIATTTNFVVCDEAGLGADNLPDLDLVPGQIGEFWIPDGF